MQISIDGRNIEVRQSWKNLIERKLSKLERYPNEVLQARVTITHNPHHNLGDNQVQVVLSVSGRTLTVKKKGAEIPSVLRTALSAVEREVEAYHQSRKRFVKTSTTAPATVVALPVTKPVKPKPIAKRSRKTIKVQSS